MFEELFESLLWACLLSKSKFIHQCDIYSQGKPNFCFCSNIVILCVTVINFCQLRLKILFFCELSLQCTFIKSKSFLHFLGMNFFVVLFDWPQVLLSSFYLTRKIVHLVQNIGYICSNLDSYTKLGGNWLNLWLKCHMLFIYSPNTFPCQRRILFKVAMLLIFPAFWCPNSDCEKNVQLSSVQLFQESIHINYSLRTVESNTYLTIFSCFYMIYSRLMALQLWIPLIFMYPTLLEKGFTTPAEM